MCVWGGAGGGGAGNFKLKRCAALQVTNSEITIPRTAIAVNAASSAAAVKHVRHAGTPWQLPSTGRRGGLALVMPCSKRWFAVATLALPACLRDAALTVDWLWLRQPRDVHSASHVCPPSPRQVEGRCSGPDAGTAALTHLSDGMTALKLCDEAAAAELQCASSR